MSLWSYQAVARGADAVMFFQWRQSLRGAEKFHSAMVPHAGEDSRVYREIVKLGNELSNISEITGSKINAEVAIVFDYDNWWAVEYDQRPSQRLQYIEQVRNFYQPLFDANIAVDILPVDADFAKYKLVIAPLLYLVKPKVKESLERYVANGGNLLVSFFSGIVDENDGVFPGGYPGPLKEVLGLKVEEVDALALYVNNSLRMSQVFGTMNGEYQCQMWGELINLTTAKALAVFGDDYYAGSPGLTENQYGNGKAYYVATQLEPQFYSDLMKNLCDMIRISAPIEVLEGVEVTVRNGNGVKYLFILNHNDYPASIILSDKYLNLISGIETESPIILNSKESIVLKYA